MAMSSPDFPVTFPEHIQQSTEHMGTNSMKALWLMSDIPIDNPDVTDPFIVSQFTNLVEEWRGIRDQDSAGAWVQEKAKQIEPYFEGVRREFKMNLIKRLVTQSLNQLSRKIDQSGSLQSQHQDYIVDHMEPWG